LTLWVWLCGLAGAYETDQLTDRELQLGDATGPANRAMAALLDEAVARTNARTGCEAPPERVHEVLAREIYRATAKPVFVFGRGLSRAPGFTAFSGSLEASDVAVVPRVAFPDRTDLYGDLTLWNSVILTLAGPCSTFEVAGVRFGSDKFDHFLDVGYHYWRLAQKHGAERALAWGTKTERSYYGMLTSKTFSYGDMRANWDGWQFYEALLGEHSAFGLGEDGCVAMARPFDWRDWVHAEWDEVLNPPVYTRLVERGVLETLEARREALCASFGRWNTAGWWEAHVAGLEVPEYVVGPVPRRRDPWQLAALCDPGRAVPLEPDPVRPRVELRRHRRGSHRGRP
jgi:hypothetical protein